MRLRGQLLLVAGVLLASGLLVIARTTAAAPPAVVTLPAAPVIEGAAELAPLPEPPASATPSPDPAPPQTHTPEPEPSPLGERLAVLLADPELQGSSIGFAVLDDEGAVRFARAADAPLLPASTQKLAVAAAAVAALGPDFRYVTAATATAPAGPDGMLQGDLVLLGSGDPALATPTYIREVMNPERPHTSLEALADHIVAAGVRHVTGGVLGNPAIFAEEPVASGWLDRYFEELDATLVSGLTVDAGRKLFIEDGDLRVEASPDPASEAAAALYTLLRQRGVTIDGGVGVTRGASPAARIAAVSSPPMSELIRYFVQRSDNHMADAVHRTLGVLDGGDGTWRAAAEATMRALSPLSLDWSGSVLADGSGLSRDDRLPALLLARLDLAMARSSAGALWDSSMAVAGESGTLKRRLSGTLGEQRLRGKTGSLRDVRSLVGSVEGPDGGRYHFALLVNGLSRSQTAAARRLQDELVLAMVENLHGLTRP